MHIQHDSPGRSYAPLETIELVGAVGGTVIVSDGARQVYLRVAADSPLRFTVGGAAGLHTALHIDAQGKLLDRCYFRVKAETALSHSGGEFTELLDSAYFSMISPSEMQVLRWSGRLYRFFNPRLRDHVQILAAMKYFNDRPLEGIDLFRQSQGFDGNLFSEIVASAPDDANLFARSQVEADTESLFVLGVFHAWQASHDDGWLRNSLDAAIAALDYLASSTNRWSEQFGLIKRGYTIDTWGALADEDMIDGDPEAISSERTRFGVAAGDNVAYILACRALATMLAHVERDAEAVRFGERANSIAARLNEVSWEDTLFLHHVPETYGLIREFGVNEDSQRSLANAVALLGVASQEQAAAILAAYQRLRDGLPEDAPGEWFTIYPPFAYGFSGYPVGESINGGASPAVAGALALGAFAHGAEGYGADILRRLLALVRGSDQQVPALYTTEHSEPISSLDELSEGWAAGSVAVALIEGLAGVTDSAAGFSKPVVAPRWVAADIDEALVTVAFPASGGYVAYRYEHDVASRQISLTVTGSGKQATCRVLLPAYARAAEATTAGASLAGSIVAIGESHYLEFSVALPGPATVLISY